MKKKMSEDRERQVKTTRERHGKDFYQKAGAMSSGKGITFRDPQKAREAALLRWAKAREERGNAG